MQKDVLWNILIKKNPHWLTDGANLTPAGLKKMFDTTFDKGHELGLLNGKVIGHKEAKDIQSKKPVSELFGGLFGDR